MKKISDEGQENTIEAIKYEFESFKSYALLSMLEALCPKELEKLLWLVAEREYERRIEDALQSEADQARGEE